MVGGSKRVEYLGAQLVEVLRDAAPDGPLLASRPTPGLSNGHDLPRFCSLARNRARLLNVLYGSGLARVPDKGGRQDSTLRLGVTKGSFCGLPSREVVFLLFYGLVLRDLLPAAHCVQNPGSAQQPILLGHVDDPAYVPDCHLHA